MMTITKNINNLWLRYAMMAVAAVVTSLSAVAVPLEPEFLANETVVSSNWYSIHLPNGRDNDNDGWVVAQSDNTGERVIWNHARNGKFRWQFVGTRNGFKVRNENGLWMRSRGTTSSTSDLEIITTANYADATTFSLAVCGAAAWSSRCWFVKYPNINYWWNSVLGGLSGYYNASGANSAVEFVQEEAPGFRVIINGNSDYTVTVGSQTAKHGEYVTLADNFNAKDVRTISINAGIDKFIYGPIIDFTHRTITFDIYDRVKTALTNSGAGWYQMQVTSSTRINTANTRIRSNGNNINTQSNYIYTVPNAGVNRKPDGDSYFLMKFTGVPTYAGEAATFVYIDPKTATTANIQSSDGHYVTNTGVAYRTPQTVTCRMDGNHRFDVDRWEVSGAADWTEAPAAAASSGYLMQYNLRKVDLSNYKVCKVVIEGYNPTGTNCTTDARIRFAGNASVNKGLSEIYSGGYFFFDAAYHPTRNDFTFEGIDTSGYDYHMQASGDGTYTITFSSQRYTLNIVKDEAVTGNITASIPAGKSSTGAAVTGIADGDALPLADTNDAALSITLEGADNYFVLGPIYNHDEQTITYKVYPLVTSIESNKWYQMQLKPTAGIVTAANTNNVVASVNQQGNTKRKSNYLYLYGEESTSNYMVDVSGYWDAEHQPNSFIFVHSKSGNNPVIQTKWGLEHGRYVPNDGNSYNTTTPPTNISWNLERQSNGSFAWHGINPWANLGSPSHTALGYASRLASTLTFNTNIREVSIPELREVYDAYRLDGDTDLVVNVLNYFTLSPTVKVHTTSNGAHYLVVTKGTPIAEASFTLPEGYFVSVDVAAGTIYFEDNTAPEDYTINITNGEGVTGTYTATVAANRSGTGAAVTGITSGSVVSIKGDPLTAVKIENDSEVFVWGPVYDHDARTLTFNIRKRAEALTAGKWYQVQLVDYAQAQWLDGSAVHTGDLLIGLNGYDTMRHDGSYFYVVNNTATNYPEEITGFDQVHPEKNSYIFVPKTSGNNIQLQFQNHYYLNTNGQGAQTEVSLSTTKQADGSFSINHNILPANNMGGHVAFTQNASARSGNVHLAFHELTSAEQSDAFDAYAIVFAGEGAAERTDVVLTYSGPDALKMFGYDENGRQSVFYVNKNANLTDAQFPNDKSFSVFVDHDAMELRVNVKTTIPYTIQFQSDIWTADKMRVAVKDGQLVAEGATSAPQGGSLFFDYRTPPQPGWFVLANASALDGYQPEFIIDHTARTITVRARRLPEFLASERAEDDLPYWYTIYMSQTGRYVAANTNSAMITPQGQDLFFRWQFIGSQTNFVLRADNGQYAYYNGGRVAMTDNYAQATHWKLVKNTASNGYDHWAIQVYNNSNTWNVYSSTYINYWGDESKPDNRVFIRSIPIPTYKEYTLLTGEGVPAGVSLTLTQSHYITQGKDYGLLHAGDKVELPTAYAGESSTYQFTDATVLPEGKALKIDVDNEANTVTFSFVAPYIAHRRHWFYDKLDNAIAQGRRPGVGIIEQPMEYQIKNDEYDAGWQTNPYTGERIQRAPNYEIVHYVKKGDQREFYFATDNSTSSNNVRLTGYQRFYNYMTEDVEDLTRVVPLLGTMNHRHVMTNGVAFWGGSGTSYTGQQRTLKVYWPSENPLEEYIIGADLGRHTDYTFPYNSASTTSGAVLEGSIDQRILFHLYDANVMARKIKAGEFEVHDISFPTVKLGSDRTMNGFDVLSLNHDFGDYWVYRGGNDAEENLMNLNNDNLLVVEVVGNEQNQNVPGKIRAMILNNTNAGFNVHLHGTALFHRFIMFRYPEVNGKKVMPDNSTQTINVYVKESTAANAPRHKIAQYNLTFVPNSELIPINEVLGFKNTVDEETGRATRVRKSNRAPAAMREQYGDPVTSVTFENRNIRYTGHNTNIETGFGYYGLPINFDLANVPFGSTDWASCGEYIVRQSSGMADAGGAKFYPVDMYEQNYETNTKSGNSDSAVPSNLYFLYYDGSEQPGRAISLKLDERLCPGSRLFLTGWMGSNCGSGNTAGSPGTYQQASVYINVLGVKADGTTSRLYTFAPGMVSSGYEDENGNLYHTIRYADMQAQNAYASGEWGIWNQFAFSFLLPPDANTKYEGYELEVMSNCYSTTGADVVIDNIEVYVNEPKATVDFTTPLCTDRMRHVKIHTDFDMLLQNSSDRDETSGKANGGNDDDAIKVSYCFLDKIVYDKYLDEYLYDLTLIVDTDGNPVLDADGNYQYERTVKEGLSDDDITNIYNTAFGDALIGVRALHGTPGHAFHNFDIPKDYESIPVYVFHTSTEDAIYRETVGLEKRIVFKEEISTQGTNPNHNWQVGKTYYLVYAPIQVSEADIARHDVGTEVFQVQTRCCFLTEFSVKGAVDVKGDATINNFDDIDACIGQSVTLAVDLAARKETEDVVLKNIVYDWWVGYTTTNPAPGSYSRIVDGEVQYPATLANYNNQHKTVPEYLDNDGNPTTTLYLSDALIEFRKAYHTATTTEGCRPVELHESEHNISLTQDMIDYIADEVNAGRLILYRHERSMAVEEDESFYVPVMVNLTDEQGVIITDEHDDAIKVQANARDAEGKPYYDPNITDPDALIFENRIYFVVMPIRENSYDVNEEAIYCPDPQEMSVRLTGVAPSMTNGLSDKTYPKDMPSVPVRLGLSQINAVRNSQYQRGARNVLRVPLRNIVTSEAEYRGVKLNPDNARVMLVASTDTTYSFSGEDMMADNYGHAVGVIRDIVAVKNGAEHYVFLTFNDDRGGNIVFREGNTYTLKLPFIDDTEGVVDPKTNPCSGMMTFDMRVVPEYQVWTSAGDSDEWTNDANWRRADRHELHADNPEDLPNYLSNHDNKTSNSYVPMSFTNVLVSEAEYETNTHYKTPVLYQVTMDSDGFVKLNENTATRYIRYELEVAEAEPSKQYAMGCDVFGTNIAKGITFEHGGELINAHFLNYQRAWVEYDLDMNRWYTLGSPLQGTFAGEWYSPAADARQTTLHFEPITYDSKKNHRFAPAFYQRSWDKATANVYRLEGDNLWVPSTATGSNVVDVVVRGDWSNVYNDVKVNYSLGGFSVKVDPRRISPALAENARALVRMPKADNSYTYYDINNDSHNEQTVHALPRVAGEQYRLFSDKFNNGGYFEQTLTNVDADNHFFLVANPLMTALDLDEFFAENSEFERKYWILTADGQSVSVKDETSGQWISTSTSPAPHLVAPLQAFFVKGTSKSANVRFTTAMQHTRFKYNDRGELEDAVSVNLQSKTPRAVVGRASDDDLATPVAFTITAERDNDVNVAAVVVNENATNAFVEKEDVETFVDSNVATSPFVYTIASGRAATINSIKEFNTLPMGVYSTDNSEVAITFDGVEALGADDVYLLDVATGDADVIYDGMTVMMSGNNAGRYQIVRDIESALTEASLPVIKSRGFNVTVKAGCSPLAMVRAVDTTGRVVFLSTNDGDEVSFDLGGGAYVIEAEAENGAKSVTKVVLH